MRETRAAPRWHDDFVTDLRYAWRTLVRTPGFSLVAVLSLALGLGANTAIFSVVDAVLLRSLPVHRPEELVLIATVGTKGTSGAPPYPCFERFRTETSAFAGMAAFATDDLRVRVGGTFEQVFGQVVSGNYFELLGVHPALGRLITTGDERGDQPIAVIGHGYWQRRYGGSPAAIGQTLVYRERTYTIVGVTPPEFWGLEPGRAVDVTLPLALEHELRADPGAWWFHAVARRRTGVSSAQAAAQVNAIFQSFMRDRQRVSGGLRRDYFDHIELHPAGRGLGSLRARFSMPLYALTLVAAMVLVIACANLASLLLVRNGSRARELAIRVATGAAGGRLLRQLLTETLVLFVLGAAAAIPLAYVTATQLTAFFAVGRNPVQLDVHYDWKLVAFAGATALGGALITGLWPGLRACRADPQPVLKGHDTRVVRLGGMTMPWRALLAGQMAIALVLLLSSVVFARTLVNLRAVDLGFSARHVLTLSVDPRFAALGDRDPRERFWTQVLDRVRALRGIRAASLSVLTPLSGRDTSKIVTGPGLGHLGETDRIVHINHVSEDYFRTFGIQLLAGRAFSTADAATAERVVLVNEATVRAYFAGRDPIGSTLWFGPSLVYRIVGVVRDQKHMSVWEPAPRFAYVPLRQRLEPIGRITLAVASDQPQASLAWTIANQVRSVHADTLVSDVIGLEEQIDATLVSERLLSILASLFAALALGLAAIGLVGIVSYSVARRRTELAVRLALGASPARVSWEASRDALIPVLLGIVIGIPLAFMTAGLARGLLFGVTPGGTDSYLLSAAVLGMVACLATWVPARRASRMDPLVALRHE